MTKGQNSGSEFIRQAEQHVLDHVSDEQFGVSELSEKMNMSRSNLLRKIKKETQLSASQFIRQIRLQRGMVLLKNSELTTTEVAFHVGFGSTSYFIKCFREYYGFPPGRVGEHESESQVEPVYTTGRLGLIITTAVIALGIVSFLLFRKPIDTTDVPVQKSIAVLPFKNESSDSSNQYFVNGLMESTLGSLQKIEGLRVISRTSVEKYRNVDLTIPEIAEELQVSYFVEGSGQKLGDQVMLNIQLIEAATDEHIWAHQYQRQIIDIFSLQNEVAKQIADAVEVMITPAELEQISKQPTDNMIAYDFYLQALEPYYTRTTEGLETAIPLFEKAIEHDPAFAQAYANMSIAYYFLDVYHVDKQYADEINNYADKALLYDPQSAECLIAKALYYMYTKDYRLALPHLEKALEYNPNSSAVVQMLADFYARIVPNTAKYLEYALMGIQLDVAVEDSITKSYTYLHLSNALVQTGFFDEAIKYINLSLDFNPNNYFSPHLKAFILFARDHNIERTKSLLIKEWQKDTTRLDILQDIAKVYYMAEEFDSAYYYFRKFDLARESSGLDIYVNENAKIGLVYEKKGFVDEAKNMFESYSHYCDTDQSIYKNASLAVKYTHEGDLDQAINHLRKFGNENNYQYWFLLMEMDPLIEPLKSHPEFAPIMNGIKDRFWENNRKLRKSLVEKGLI